MIKLKSLAWGKILKSPFIILGSVVLGIVLGLSFSDYIGVLVWFGQAYLSFLKLCALPILLSAIIIGTNRLLRGRNSRSLIVRLLVCVFATFIIGNTIAMAIALIFQTGQIDDSLLSSLGSEVNKTGIDYQIYLRSTSPVTDEDATGFILLFRNLITDNIFNSLSEGNTLQVLVFSIVFGTALSFIPKSPLKESFIGYLDLIFQIFNSIVKSALIVLPLALIGLIGGQVSSTGLGTVNLMLGFVILSNVCFAAVYLLSAAIIWWRSNCRNLLKFIPFIKETTLLAITTSNSFACLPPSLSMMKDLGFNGEKVDAILPINIITFRYGTSVYFVFATMFVLYIYQEPIALDLLLTVVFGCILASISSLGLVGIAALGSIEVVCRPLGLPVEAVLLLFIAIDPLVNPLRALVNVYGSMMVTSLITNEASPTASVEPTLKAPVKPRLS